MQHCTIEGCDKKVQSKGLCSAHYHKQRRALQKVVQSNVAQNIDVADVAQSNNTVIDTTVRTLFDKTLELAKRVQELEAITERFSKPFEQACIDGTLLSYLAEAKLAGSRNASVINQQIKADAANEARNKEIDQITDPIDPITDEECEAIGLDELMSGEEA